MLLLLATVQMVLQGTAASGYMEPARVLVDIVDVEWAPWASMSPDRTSWLMVSPRRNPSIEELAREELRLAGLRFSPETLAPTRTSRYTGFSLMRYPELETVGISGLPRDLLILRVSWSPDGSMAAFTRETAEGVELWVVDAALAEARPLTGPQVSLTASEFPQWLPDGSGLLCCMAPEGIGEPPVEDPVPHGPVIQETTGEEAPARTYQDLLENPYQEDLFQHYLTSRLSLVGLDGSVRTVGEPGMIWYFSVSPDGSCILVSRLQRPFSYSVTAGRFSETVEVWDMEGNVLLSVAELPVRDRIPLATGSTFQGPRSIQWRSDTDAELVWVEALDGGDAGIEASPRDRVLTLEAPFTGEPLVLMELGSRFSGIQWGSDTLAIVSEWWWPTRNWKSWWVRPGETDSEPVLLFDRSWEDRYGDPGTPVTTRNARGRQVLLVSPDGTSVYLEGEGASPEGDRPFLDRLDLGSMETSRLFRSSPPFHEEPVGFADSLCTLLLFTREAPGDYPDYFLRDLAGGGDTQVTFREDPLPMFDGMSKELITYSRADGVELSATLYLPPGYGAGDGPLPMVMWAYPREFVSADAAGQVSGSPYSYDYIGWWSPVVWLSMGYAVLDDPAMPIIGEEGEEPNDTFVEQLSMGAEAAVEEVVRRGVAHRDRIAVGGVSYGAFMTANLLVHTDLFAAGIAMTGAYNRTLTPFGFQSEDRTLWDAPEVYVRMSPFMHADMLDEPILLVHGQADDNPGTFPIQSERFFAALRGLGGTARLVLLPLESHGYRARESILHVLWETQEWLDRHISQ